MVFCFFYKILLANLTIFLAIFNAIDNVYIMKQIYFGVRQNEMGFFEHERKGAETTLRADE